ncbi:hypothetical protein HMPREF1612_04105, partial [Escherichia coli 908585]
TKSVSWQHHLRRAVNCAERNKKRYVKKGPGKIVYGRKGI